MKEDFIQNIQFDLFSVELVIGETATLLLAENYVTIREVFVDGAKVEPNAEKQIFLPRGGDDLWELNEGDILQPKEDKTFTIKKAYEVNAETGSTDKYLNEQGDFTKPINTHSEFLGKNAESDFQHIDTTITKETLVEADKVAILDSVTGKVVLTYKTNVGVQSTKDILYADLLALINNNELIPDSSYRITDYTTTTAQADTTSARHDFDIIVTALSTNELSENAKCVRKASDTYFTNAQLEAWEIKYCIHNDTSRFAWADTANGKGVIYYMKDEWNNECPYDFKNIQYQTRQGFKYSQWGNNYTFTRDSSLDMIIADVQYYGYVCDRNPSAWSSNMCWLRDNPTTTVSVMYTNSGGVINYGGNITTVSNENYDVYTFSKTKTTSEDFDVSLNGLLYYCYNNTIRPYVTTQEHKYQLLNRITFVGWSTSTSYPGLHCYGNTFGDACYDNTFGSYCMYNTFGNSCNYNTFGDDCYSNTFGNGCGNNTFGNSCNYNTFGADCRNNTFGADCRNNTFDNMCSSNTLGDRCEYNTFSNDCYSNTFGNGCGNNTFGNGCCNNTFGNNCYSNTFGNGCGNNTFGNDCCNNTFGNNCHSNTFGNGCGNNTFDDECRNNTFGDYCFYNTFGNGCYSNNFYAGDSGTTNKDFIKSIVLEDGCMYNNFYSTLTTSSNSYLQRIRIKGLEHTTPTSTKIDLSAVNTNYEWVICYTSSGVLKQYCPND